MDGLFRGTWYRSEVELKGETITPIPPFEPYNPFDRYYSARDIRQGQKSLYVEFLSVDATRPEAVLRFCQQFGVLGSANRLAKKALQNFELEMSHPRYQLSQEVLKDLQIDLVGRFEQARLGPETLCTPMTVTTFHNTQLDFKEALGSYVKGHPFLTTEEHFKERAALLLNFFLRSARVNPQIKWNPLESQWELLWNCLELTGLLAVMLMLDLHGPGKLLACPRCHTFFVTTSNLTKYCSKSCYHNFKVQKYLKKKKENALASTKGTKKKTVKPSTRKAAQKGGK